MPRLNQVGPAVVSGGGGEAWVTAATARSAEYRPTRIPPVSTCPLFLHASRMSFRACSGSRRAKRPSLVTHWRPSDLRSVNELRLDIENKPSWFEDPQPLVDAIISVPQVELCNGGCGAPPNHVRRSKKDGAPTPSALPYLLNAPMLRTIPGRVRLEFLPKTIGRELPGTGEVGVAACPPSTQGD